MKWIDTNESLPYCYETGNWDGKKSDLFLGETITGNKFLGECFEGILDGHYYFEWYAVDEITGNDYSINEPVSRWMRIPF